MLSPQAIFPKAKNIREDLLAPFPLTNIFSTRNFKISAKQTQTLGKLYFLHTLYIIIGVFNEFKKSIFQRPRC